MTIRRRTELSTILVSSSTRVKGGRLADSALCRYFWLLSWGAPNWTHGLPQSQVHQPSRWLYIGPSTLKPPVGSGPVGSLPLQPWVQPQPGRPANPRVHLSPSSSVLSDMWSCSQMPLWPQDAFRPHQVVPITGQQCDTNFSKRKKNIEWHHLYCPAGLFIFTPDFG